MKQEPKTIKYDPSYKKFPSPNEGINLMDFSPDAWRDGQLGQPNPEDKDFVWYQQSYKLGEQGVMPYDMDIKYQNQLKRKNKAA